jgi:hypothetical protein
VAEKRELEASKQDVVQIDDLLTFRQFTKKGADDAIDVCIPSDQVLQVFTLDLIV